MCGLLLLLFTLAEFVRPPAAPPQAAPVAQTAKSADGEAAPPSPSTSNLNGDVTAEGVMTAEEVRMFFVTFPHMRSFFRHFSIAVHNSFVHLFA
jgi:hypothetical protein